MRRRKFIALLGSATVAWPLAARAQRPAMPVVGFMSARSPEESAHLVAAFRRGLGEGGFFEGQNVALEFRWARGQYDRLPALALGRGHETRCDLSTGIDARSNHLQPRARAAPGGRTGQLAGDEGLGLLKEAFPDMMRVGVLRNPRNPSNELQLA